MFLYKGRAAFRSSEKCRNRRIKRTGSQLRPRNGIKSWSQLGKLAKTGVVVLGLQKNGGGVQ